MSWSITRTGTPEEVGDAIKHAILQSANYTPLSQRRSRTAELAAANIRAIVVGATEHGVSTGAKPPQIVGYSSGQINDDGSMSTGAMSFSFVREIPKAARTSSSDGTWPRRSDEGRSRRSSIGRGHTREGRAVGGKRSGTSRRTKLPTHPRPRASSHRSSTTPAV
jgi:hypothetical protein